MWYLFALFSAFFYSFRGILEKKIIHKVNKYILGLAIRLFALPFFFIPFFINPSLGIPLHNLNLQFWVAVIIVSCIQTPLETIFYYEALKEEEVSLVVPILSLAPALTIIFGAIILKEMPSLWGIMGILLITFGIYALKLDYAKEGILEPLKHLHSSRGVRLMAVVMVSVGLGSIFDKMGVTNSNPQVYALANYLAVCLSLVIVAWLKARKHFGELKKYFGWFFLIGSFVAGYTFFYTIALQTGYAAYVITLKNASILFTMIFSFVFLKEKGLKQKLLAALFIFLGLICIKVFN